MNTEFAGCDEQQSGLRFLDSSAPRLIQHVASCETAAGDDAPLVWDTYPLPAGKDQKLSWGFGGEAPEFSARCAAALSSLDSLTNNRHGGTEIPPYYRRPIGRGKFCGRLSVAGIDPKTGRKNCRRINCGGWACSYCGPRKARTARHAIRTVAAGLGLQYFLTLTLDPKKVPGTKHQIKYLKTTYNKFREYLKRKFGTAPKYITVVELTKKGVPHLHILIDRYIPQAWISNVWSRLGGGHRVWIERVEVRDVARYLSKYLTKELLLSAPKGTRRITTARGIKLFPKFKSAIAWELQQYSIWRALERERMLQPGRQFDLFSFITLQFDTEQYLTAFEVHAPPLQPELPSQRKAYKDHA
jgi:hypothetical protein